MTLIVMTLFCTADVLRPSIDVHAALQYQRSVDEVVCCCNVRYSTYLRQSRRRHSVSVLAQMF